MNELILIVEDEEDVAELLRYNLQKQGYRTVVASDGEQALRAVQYGDPDLVLLDIMLPEMDGWAVCRIIRESERGASLPVIMVTALSMEEARVQGLRLGADDYVTKPFSLPELLLRIRRLLDRDQALKELRTKTTAQDDSMKYLVHELKNSLSLMDGYSHLAQTAQQDSPYLHHIRSAADHMDQVLEQMSVLVRLERDRNALERRPVEVLPIVEEAVESFRGAVRDAGINISLEGKARSAVLGNATALRQVLVNLLSNAVKYNRPGGNVVISLEGADRSVNIIVRDEGVGIRPEELPKVFDKFFRGTGVAGVKGAGLGLHVVKLLVEAMQGSVSIASSEHGGTTVTVILAKAPGAHRAATPAGSTERSREVQGHAR